MGASSGDGATYAREGSTMYPNRVDVSAPKSIPAATLSIGRRPFSPVGPAVARSGVGLANRPTVVAMGPFHDVAYVNDLTAGIAFVQRHFCAQLVLLGSGAERVATRSTATEVQRWVHWIESAPSDLWSNVVAAADVLLPNPASGLIGLLDALAAGRAVVAAVDPTTFPVVVCSSVGLVYRPGDFSAMARALLRILTNPALRHGMSSRASDVARRHKSYHGGNQHGNERKGHV
jgi:glycosyltransferase involved in cell wall biosynthesis